MLESVEVDSRTFMEAVKRLYPSIDDIVILIRDGDSLMTFGSNESDAVTKAVIHVADKFHNHGQKRF